MVNGFIVPFLWVIMRISTSDIFLELSENLLTQFETKSIILRISWKPYKLKEIFFDCIEVSLKVAGS